VTHRAWFTLVVRLMGLWLLVTNLVPVWWTFASMVTNVQSAFEGAIVTPAPVYGWWERIAALIDPALGAYLLFGAKWLIDRCLREAEAAERASAG
jgi:hypothetical protein